MFFINCIKLIYQRKLNMNPNIPSNRSGGASYIIPCKYEKIDELNRPICDFNN